MKLDVNISYFEQLLDVTFVETTRGKYRAKEHSSYAISTAKDGTLLFCSYNGDYGDKHLNAYGLTKRIFPNLNSAAIRAKLGQKIEHSDSEPAPQPLKKQTTDVTEQKAEQKIIVFQADDKALSVFRTFHYFQKKIRIKSLQDLKNYPIKTIQQYGKIHDRRLKTPFFAYCEGDNIKVKDPQKTIFKSKVVLKTPIQDYVFGLEHLRKIPNEVAKKIYVVITEGEDDAFAINYHCQQVKALTFGGVTNALNPFIIKELNDKFAGVLIGFDNDAAGIKNAPLQAAKHQLPYFICPTNIFKQKHLKDFCDLLSASKFNSNLFEHNIVGEIYKAVLEQQQTLQHQVKEVITNNNLTLSICTRQDAFQIIQQDSNALVLCENNYISTAQKLIDNRDTPIYDYKDLCKIKDMRFHIYCLGSQLLQRNAFAHVAQKLLDLAPHYKITLFADTDTNLPFATSKQVILDLPTNYKVLAVENHKATFLTLAKNMPYAKILECGKSLMSSIDKQRIVLKSDLGFVDKNCTLLVYVNEDLHILPNEYQGYKEVIFICNKMRYPSVTTIEQFIYTQQLLTETIIKRLADNPKYYLERDIMAEFSHALIKPIFDNIQQKWVVPVATLNALAYQKQCDIYAKDFSILVKNTHATLLDFEELMTQINTEKQTIQQQIEENNLVIKENVKALKDERKAIFQAFANELAPYADTLENVLQYAKFTAVTITDVEGNEKTIVEERRLKAAEKLFITRLKAICKFVNIDIGFDLVKKCYHNFKVALQRARVDKALQRRAGESEYNDNLKDFVNKFTEGWHQKDDLIAEFEEADVGHRGGDAWKQVRKGFFIASKTMRINGVVTRVYRLILLSDFQSD